MAQSYLQTSRTSLEGEEQSDEKRGFVLFSIIFAALFLNIMAILATKDVFKHKNA